MQNEEIIVSVFMVTFNHSKYIDQALNSVLSQNVNFKYEIVIADDCSTDNTQEIINKYYKKFPNIIRPIFRKKNIGASKNSFYGIRQCKGKYIALLEGDDFWIDDNKLSIQVEFMEKNNQYIACAHKNIIVDADGKKIFDNKMFERNYKKIYTFDDLKQYGHGFHTATILYKNIYLKNDKKMKNLFLNCTVGDIILMYLLLDMGNIYIFDKYMSAWRCVTNQNNWTSLSKKQPLLMALNRYNDYIKIRDYFGKKRKFGTKEYDYICGFYVAYFKNGFLKGIKELISFIKYIGILKFIISLPYSIIYVIKKVWIIVKRKCVIHGN